jgi:RNA polymerase primary sigma factor
MLTKNVKISIFSFKLKVFNMRGGYMAKPTKSTLNRSDHTLDQYLQEIGEVSLLNHEEEIALARRIREGDELSLERLTKANLRFVVSVAKQYQSQGLSLGDLINEGNLGLIKAANRFDETRGFKFISYAVWWIRQSILQALAEQSRIVRLPLNRVGTMNKIGKAFSALEQEFEREPSPEEIAELLEISDFEVSDTIQKSGKHLSLDAPFSEEEENRLLDIIENQDQPSPDNTLISESLRIELDRALSTLTQREAEVVKLYFGLDLETPLTLEEIGEKFKLTRERVRQIKEKALRRLRHASRSKPLRSYLG